MSRLRIGPLGMVDSPTIVLLGLGHTNAHIVKMWASAPLPGWRLVCISKFPTATYSGMFPGTLAGQFEDWEFRIDLAALVEDAGAELLLADVIGLNREAGQVLFSDRGPLRFDLLSIGVGSMPAGWQQHASCPAVVPIKPMQNFQERLELRLEAVENQRTISRQANQSLQIAVVGGGAASVEIALCLDQRLRSEGRYQNYGIAIYTQGHRVCQDMHARSISLIEHILQTRSIRFHYGQAVTQVESESLITADGRRHDADCAIWATGAAAPPVLAGFPLQKDDRGFIAIGPTLQSLTDPRIFAVGDSGSLVDKPFPKAGVFAVRQCPVLWHNLKSMAFGEKLQDFLPQSDFLKLLNTGDGKAVLEYGRLTTHARWCWHLKTWIDKRFVREFQVEAYSHPQNRDSASNRTQPKVSSHGSNRNPEYSIDSGASSKSSLKSKLIVLLFVAVIILLVWLVVGDQLTLSALAQRESQLKELVSQRPLLAGAMAMTLYVLVTGLSLPGAAALSLVYGWVFGFWRGLFMVSFASTAGATLAFLISRYFLRDWIQSRIGKRLQVINDALEREGAYYLFTLRLVPLVPFFVINAAMGLTGIRTRTFWWVSQIGMLPGTIAYVYAGSVVPNVQTLAEKGASGVLDLRLLVAFTILGALPITLKKAAGWFGSGRAMTDSVSV